MNQLSESPFLVIPIVITFATIICYYFGKLISDVQPQQEEKTAIYLHGFYFVLMFIIFPILTIYTVYNLNDELFIFNLQGNSIIAILLLLLQFSLLYYMNLRFSSILIARQCMEKLTMSRIIGAVFEDKLLIKYSKPSQRKWLRDILTKVLGFFFLPLKSKSAFLISLLTLFISIILIAGKFAVIFQFITLFLSLLIISMVAPSLYAKKPEPIEIILDSEKSITGILSKIEDGYVTLIDKTGISYNINKDKISFLKRNLRESYNRELTKNVKR